MNKIYKKISIFADSISFLKASIALIISIALLVSGLINANKYYELSKYPVSLFQGQLAFSPEKVMGRYQSLITYNTLDLYISVQYIDFIFIFGLMMTIFFTQILIVKLNPKKSRWYTFAIGMCLWGPILATADIWENITTLIMLSNPIDFSPWLAYLASSFTVWKLGWSIVGTSLVIIQIVSLLYRKITTNSKS